MPRTVKVAVIGSGLAGLTAAHLLCLPCHDDAVEFEVHLFEKVCISQPEYEATTTFNSLLPWGWTLRRYL